MGKLDTLLTSLLFLTPLLHLLLSPYTKVEESFNMQATHDILVYGTPTHDMVERLPALYDHFTFPGAVPRTFVGAVLLAGVSQPVLAVTGFAHAQTVVRFLLGLFNAGCLGVFRGAVGRAFGEGVARWWVLMMACQFHVWYYLSRTLPNMFAFGLTTLALAALLPKPNPQTTLIRQRQAIGLLVFAAAIFRSEVAILLASSGLCLVLLPGRGAAPRPPLFGVLVPVTIGTSLAALALSVPVDSYFWQKLVWPELWGFYFNAVLGSSSEWGTSPWHYYFTSALPRLLLNPLALPLVWLALLLPGTASQTRILTMPSLLYLAIYSFQPHKEARFIFYVIPTFTCAAAIGANYISSRRAKSTAYKLGTLLISLSIPAAFAGSMLMLLVSSLNYPGGDALSQIRAITARDPAPTISVHADVLTCMTGLTLFGQNPAGLPLAYGPPYPVDMSSPILLFDKTEENHQFEWPRFWKQFDYVLMQDPSAILGEWEVLGMIHGFDGIEVLRPGSVSGESDPEKIPRKMAKPPGLGADVARIRDVVRGFTGGWWIGPRMSPRIHVMRQVRDT